MISNLRNNYYTLIAYSIVLGIIIVLLNPYILYVLPLLGIIAIVHYYGERLLIGLILINFLSGLTEYIGNLRVYLNILSTIVLIFIFLKHYGFSFVEYPKIPKQLFIFLTTLFFSLTLSTLFSKYLSIGFFSILTMVLFFFLCYLLYALLSKVSTVYDYIYSISIAVLIVGIRIFYDLFTLGLENFFKKAILEGNPELAGSTGYTGFTIFFISMVFLVAFLFIDKFNKPFNKFALIWFMIINFTALIFANSRAAIIASILSISFLLLFLKRKQFINIFLTSIVVFISIYLIVPSVEETINLYVRVDSINQREVFWESGYDVILDYPILGVGPGTFHEYFYSYAPSSLFDFFYLDIWRYGKPSPHNLFLHYWAENGVLGFITAISLFVLFFYFAFMTIKLTQNKNNNYFIISLTITALGIGFLFRAFFEVTGVLYYGYIATDLPFWLLFGILIHIYQTSVSLKKKSVL